jgi:hypothetical protein
MIYSTFLGGTRADFAQAVAVDGDGNAYVAGRTFSSDLPMLNPWQPDFFAPGSVFLAKFSPDGDLLFSTYFGTGTGHEVPEALTIDRDGNILIVGFTSSVDLPTTPGAYQEEYAGGTAFGRGDGFIAKFSSDGSQLLYCSYLGGSGDDTITSIAVDSAGNMVVAGATLSRDFPASSVLGPRGITDMFIVKLDSSGGQMLWSKLIGGKYGEWAIRMRVGLDDAVYFAGRTGSPDLPVTTNARNSSHQLCRSSLAGLCEQLLLSTEWWDGFFGILEADGSNLRYLSYYGYEFLGSSLTWTMPIVDLALSPSGAVFVVGGVGEPGTPTKDWPSFQRRHRGELDGFVARLDPPDWRVSWFSYLGGSVDDWGVALALDRMENVYVIGQTQSYDFPLRDALPKRGDGSLDGFLAKITPDGETLLYSTLLGGSEEDLAVGIAIRPDGSPVIVGQTKSEDFPIARAYQPVLSGTDPRQDAFVLAIQLQPVRPKLEVTRSGESLIISWLAEAEDFVLESSARPQSGAWTAVPGAPLLLGDQKAVVTRPAEQAQFFRLKRP